MFLPILNSDGSKTKYEISENCELRYTETKQPILKYYKYIIGSTTIERIS